MEVLPGRRAELGTVTEADYLTALAAHLGFESAGLPSRAEPTDRALERCGDRLRSRWRERALECSRGVWPSPLYAARKPLPLGGEAHFTYERSLWPEPLETLETPGPAGWDGEALVCRHRAAAWWTGLLTLQDLWGRPLRLRSWRLDPALRPLFEGCSERRWQWSEALSPETLLSSLAEDRAELFVIPPEALALEEWASAWKARSTPALLWIDLERRPCFPWNIALDRLRPAPALTVLADSWQGWQSGGLELPVLGRLRWLAPAAAGMSDLAAAAELSRRVRSVVGAAPSFADLCLWDARPPRAWRVDYRERIREHAAAIRRELDIEVDDSGAFLWTAPEPEQVLAIGGKLASGRGGLGPRWDGERWAVGWRSPERLIELLRGRRRRPPRPSPAPLGPAWPQAGGRRSWLRCADRRPPETLECLEQRLRDYERGRPLLFSSAMAALATLAATVERVWPEAPRTHLGARYFESVFLHRILGLEEHPQADVLFLESVQYDWELSSLQTAQLPPARLQVLDTTLSGTRRGLDELPPAPLQVRFCSGLKLDQRGWEIENCGALWVSGEPGLAAFFATELERRRAALGTQPGELQRRRLSIPWVFDLEVARRHSEAVLANNAELAGRLRPGGLLERAVYPESGAPFVVLHLTDPSIESHRRLSAALEWEARRRRLPLARGASFGFQDHRHEFIIPVLRENRALLKVAMGARRGAGFEGVVRTLQQVLGLADSTALERAYPDLEPAPPARDWSSPSARLLDYLAQEGLAES